jgi:hypothetical protein
MTGNARMGHILKIILGHLSVCKIRDKAHIANSPVACRTNKYLDKFICLNVKHTLHLVKVTLQ